MTTKEFANIINKTNGRFFHVAFYKKDGSLRILNGQSCHIDLESLNEGYITVFDIKKRAWRRIRTDSVVSFKCGNHMISSTVTLPSLKPVTVNVVSAQDFFSNIKPGTVMGVL